MRVGGKRTKPLSIEVLCDWAKRVQPTTTQRQRRRVYFVVLCLSSLRLRLWEEGKWFDLNTLISH